MAISNSWSDDRRALLAEMHERGPKVIWEALNKLPGPQLTKCSVIGMRDRLYMNRQPKKTQEEIIVMCLARRERNNAAIRARRAKAAKKAPVNFNRVEAAKERQANGGDPAPYVCIDAADVVPLHLNLLDLKRHHCRWPYGEDPFTFCGQPVLDGSYCFAHKQLSLPHAKPVSDEEQERRRQHGAWLSQQARHKRAAA